MSAENLGALRGEVDITYHTQQRDVFASGLVAQIGPNAFAIWNAIKSHADFATGDSYPGIRRLARITGLSANPVQDAIKKLVEHHLLRVVSKPRKTNHYIARERLDVKVGARVVCTVVVDYVPAQMRKRLARLKAATSGDTAGLDGEDVWAQVEVIPGAGMKLDAKTGTFKAIVRADEVPAEPLPAASVEEAKRKLRKITDEMRTKSPRTPPNK
jgi:hypothetical protein